MNIKAKLAAILTGLLIGGTAFATTCITPGTIGGWGTFVDAGAGACDSDTSWTLVSNTANIAGAGLTLTEDVLGGVDNYALVFDFSTLTGGHLGPSATASITYTVLILNPLEFWTNFRLDSTCAGGPPDCTVSKTVNGVTLVSLNGAPAGPGALSGLLLTVTETFTTGATGFLTNATDTYQLNNRTIQVPEPMSLALLGIGLAGLGFATRRRKI